jgi:hypothetical protein
MVFCTARWFIRYWLVSRLARAGPQGTLGEMALGAQPVDVGSFG